MTKAIWKSYENDEWDSRPSRLKVRKENTKQKEKKARGPSKSREILAKLSNAICGLDSQQKVKAKLANPKKIEIKLTGINKQAKEIRKFKDEDIDWLLDSDNFTSSEEDIYEEIKTTPRRLLKHHKTTPPPIPTTPRPYSLPLRRSPRLREKAREQSSLKSNLMDSICSLKCFQKKAKTRPPSRHELDQKMYSVQQQVRQTWPKFRKLEADTDSDSIYEEIQLRSKPKSGTRKPPPVPPKPKPYILSSKRRT